jgi:hypothetical protein
VKSLTLLFFSSQQVFFSPCLVYFLLLLFKLLDYITLFTLVLLRLLGGVILFLEQECIFKLLVCVWLHSVFGQNHLYVKMLLTGIPLFRSVSEDSALFCKSEISIPCQPSGRRVIPFGRPSVHCSIRLDDVPYRPDARQTM